MSSICSLDSTALPKVVIVDDSKAFLSGVTKLISERYNVTTYISPLEALQQITQNPPDIIVCDLLMPELHGFDFIRKIRENPKMMIVPILVITNNNDTEAMSKSISIGADAFCAKETIRYTIEPHLLSLIRLKETYKTISSSSVPTPQPNTVSNSAPSTTTSKKTNEASACHIFIIDDEVQILDIVEDTLADEGFKISKFDKPEKFLEAIKTQSPDVVVTDFKMPKLSGLDVLKAVRERNADTPVIILTGFITKEILMDSLKVGGFYRAIEKPFKDVNLIQDCWSAYRYHEVKKMMRRSLNLLVYQFSDLEKFLISKGQEDVAKTMGNELKDLLKKSRSLGQKT